MDKFRPILIKKLNLLRNFAFDRDFPNKLTYSLNAVLERLFFFFAVITRELEKIETNSKWSVYNEWSNEIDLLS